MKIFRKAVLVIHGFCGGLSDNEFLVNQLESNFNFDVYAWTLPHHEKYRMKNVDYREWVQAVEEQMDFLITHGYRSIYVVGHSMGGVLTCYLASKYPQIKKIVLLSPAFDCLSFKQYREDIFHFFQVRKERTSYTNLWEKSRKATLSSRIALLKLIRQYRKILPEVKTPCLVLFGEKDEVVPYQILEYVKTHIGSSKVICTTVTDGRHVLVRSQRQKEIISYIETYLKGGFRWKRMKKSKI